MHHMVRGGERDPPRCAAHLWVRSFAASVEVSVTPREVGTGEFGPMHEFVGDFEEVPFGGSRWYRVPFALWVLAGDVQRRSRNGVIDVRVGYPPSLARFLGIRMNDSVIPVPDAFATRLPHGLPQLHLDASAEMCLVTTAFPWRRTGQHRDRGVFVPVR